MRLPPCYLSGDFLTQMASCSRHFLLHKCNKCSRVGWTDADIRVDTSDCVRTWPFLEDCSVTMTSPSCLSAVRSRGASSLEVRAVMLGVTSPVGARKIFMQRNEAFTDRLCWSLGMSGRPDEQTPSLLEYAFPACTMK